MKHAIDTVIDEAIESGLRLDPVWLLQERLDAAHAEMKKAYEANTNAFSMYTQAQENVSNAHNAFVQAWELEKAALKARQKANDACHAATSDAGLAERRKLQAADRLRAAEQAVEDAEKCLRAKLEMEKREAGVPDMPPAPDPIYADSLFVRIYRPDQNGGAK